MLGIRFESLRAVVVEKACWTAGLDVFAADVGDLRHVDAEIRFEALVKSTQPWICAEVSSTYKVPGQISQDISDGISIAIGLL